MTSELELPSIERKYGATWAALMVGLRMVYHRL